MKFGSVCSGIEAASVAWNPLGWQAAWFAEIEPFPCAVLAHHYPTVPNLGDMTTIARRVLTGEVAAPDVFCGGTPCFTAGHMVITQRGYVPIEEIVVGDMVVTHKGRLRRVVRIGSKIARVGRRPAGRKGQSVLRGSAGRGIEIPEDVPSARMQCEAPRERVLHEARAAGEARDYWNGATEQERSGKGWVGEAPLAVRRLIVEECEFLQGFPRGYSKIPWRNKPASECPDGPRYKALGNSWAVPCVTWLGRRIAASLE